MVGAILLTAAVGKAHSPTTALILIQYVMLDIVPGDIVARLILAAVVLAEAFMGAMLVLGSLRRSVVGVAAVTTVLLSVFLLALTLDPDAPESCGCFGVLNIWGAESGRHGPLFARNIAMLSLLGVAWWAARPGATQGAVRSNVPPHSAQSGFSLVELLVCIAIIAVLIALVLPSFRRSRVLAQDTISQSTQRQLVGSLHLYAQDFEDGLVFLAEPGDPFAPVTYRGASWSWQGFFSDQSRYWASAVVNDYFAGPQSAIEPPDNGEPVSGTSQLPSVAVSSMFWLTQSAFATPPFWVDAHQTGIQPDPAWIAGSRMSDIAHPSAKGLLVDYWRGVYGPHLNERMDYFLAAKADGSAGSYSFSGYDWSRVVLNPFYGATAHPVLATQDGVRGRDF